MRRAPGDAIMESGDRVRARRGRRTGYRIVLDKHHDGFGNLLWLEQNRRDRLFALFGCHLGAAASGSGGVHPTRADAVDADAHPLLEGSERSGQTHYPGFGRAILGRVVGLETDPTHGRDVHDRPLPASSHGANTEVYAQHHAAEVEVDGTSPLFGLTLREVGLRNATSVVDQHVQATELAPVTTATLSSISTTPYLPYHDFLGATLVSV